MSSSSKRNSVSVAVFLPLTLLIGGLSISSCTVANRSAQFTAPMTAAPWFAGYVDLTVPSSYEIDKPPTAAAHRAVLAFIVANRDDPCTPSWGGYYSMDEAGSELDLDRRISRLRNEGGDVVVSFGGQLDDELATVCSDETDLGNAYRSVIDRYDVRTIDLDIEGNDLDDGRAGARRAKVIAALQREYGVENPLRVWVTLPVTPAGLTDKGVPAVAQMLDAGVDLAGVNIMTMNYSASRQEARTMLEASISAARAAHGQLQTVYKDAGKTINSKELWRKIGLTPMIGHNDVDGEVTDLAAAEGLNEFAQEQGIGRISMWSLNRDRACGAEEAEESQPSNTCSGLTQRTGDFSRILGESFTAVPASPR